MDKAGRIYLDWASGAPVSKDAYMTFSKAIETFGNPSSPHTEGERARQILEEARLIVARLSGTKPEAVVFTSGATESNNLAIQGSVRALQAKGIPLTSLHLLYLPTAHSSVIETMRFLERQGITIEPLIITDGAVDLDAFRQQVRPETVLVSMDLVCGETGTRYDARNVRRVLDAAREKQTTTSIKPIASRITLHVDASQAPFVESFEHTHLGADIITLDAQKIGGIRGIGALIRPSTRTLLEPLFYGGGQEEGLRPGTENPAFALAFANALTEAHEGIEDFRVRAQNARTKLQNHLSASVSNMSVNVGKEYAPHILNISFLNRDTDYAVMLLSESGFALSTKSACETDVKGSEVVFALTKDKSRSLSTLRISWGPTTKDSELEKFAIELIRIIAFLDANSIGY